MKNSVPYEHVRFAKEQRRSPTLAEIALWQVLRGGRFQGWKFKRQVPYGPYVADFSCAKARLIVELDGPVHESNEQKAHDAIRDRWFTKRGFRVLRLPNDLVFEAPEHVRCAIETALEPETPLSRPSLTRGSPSP